MEGKSEVREASEFEVNVMTSFVHNGGSSDSDEASQTPLPTGSWI